MLKANPNKIRKAKLNNDYANWYMQAFMEAGGLIDTATAARLLCTSHTTIQQRRRCGTIRSYTYNDTEGRNHQPLLSLRDTLIIGICAEIKAEGIEINEEEIKRQMDKLREAAIYSLEDVVKPPQKKEQEKEQQNIRKPQATKRKRNTHTK